MNYKKFGILFIITFVISIVLVMIINIVIDPYFHYHKPLKSLNYYLNNERYQNYGIVKHFEYDSIITGTSMTQNFKSSEFNKLFNANSIKVSLSGAYFKEVNELLETAFQSKNDIKYVVRSLDYGMFFKDKNEYAYSSDHYPIYLYNNSILDDIKYVLNKTVFLQSISTLNNKKQTTFDEYSYWANRFTFGKDVVDKVYYRTQKSNQISKNSSNINKNDLQKIEDNINQNVISLIKRYPNTEFYLFYPPYSIYSWDYKNQIGKLNKYLEGEKIITEMLLKYDNVHVFSFLDEYDIITNMDNYKDESHYSPDINSFILKSMNRGEHQLNKENYKEYYSKIIEYYNNYDYNSLFK